MKTKSLVRFSSRAAHLDVDIELADVLKISIQGGLLHTAGHQYIFDKVDPQQHPRLAARANTTGSRKLAANNLKTTLCEAYLKNIYEDASQYYLEILTAAARNGLDPNRLIGEHKVSFEANEVLQAGNWNNVVTLVAKSVFRKLENERSTKKLVEKMNNKLNLGVPQAIIDAALPYFEIRHLLVHSDGKADQDFCNSFPAFNATAGQRIKLDYALLQDARYHINELINEFDDRIVANNVVGPSELQP